ncbi:MAG: glycosyltransferase family 4 protein [Candidatus Aenigmarchaeota archaeon]|nr:glycosyltransferase family 4 protein [Candidatus Aenigmarchaeota archaeon]
MRIIFGHELFPPDFAGGGEKLMLRLTKWLASHGHSVEVVTSGNPAIKSYEGVRTVRVPANRYLMNLAGLLPMVVRGRTADIVQASSGNMCLPSYAAARLLGKPSVCWVHHIFGKHWRDIRGPVIGRLFEFMERIMLTRGFDAWVFQNESSMRIGLSMGIDQKKVRMITPGVDLEVFSPAKSVKRDGSVLFVGSLSMDEPAIRTKGLKYVLEAAAMLPDVEFKIMGRYAKRMEHTPNVRFVGTTDQKGLVRMYRKAGVVVCASLNEGFGIALLEAMACGCPIVSTVDIGQAGPKPGSKDGRALANAIRGYVGGSKAAADGRRNVTAARKHTWENFYRGFERIYDGLNKHRSK